MKIINKGFIFKKLPTPSCHASTIVKLRNGRYIAAWFGGTEEGADDVEIWSSVCENNVWKEPKTASRERGIPHWNPVLFADDADVVYLFYKIGHTIADWKTMFAVSKDGGESWSEARELLEGDTSGGRGPVKNKPIRVSNGKILAPASTELDRWQPFIDIYSEEDGWKKSYIYADLLDGENVELIQPSLWEFPKGHIHALLRSNRGKIFRSDSEDFGESWTKAYPIDIPNNNSGIDCAILDDGKIVLVCNPVEENFGKRTPLSVYLSSDNGKTFEKCLDLETEDGEFSYPAVINTGDKIFVTYTWKRKKIAFCELAI